MKKMIDELEPGDFVDEVFLVGEKEVATDKNNFSYLSLKLQDRSGCIDGKMWKVTQAAILSFKVDDFIRIKANVEVYKNELQLNIASLKRVDDKEIDLTLYLPTSVFDVNVMLEEIKEILSGIENESLKTLTIQFLEDEDFINKFKRAPAGVRLHHSYLGGLLHHTLSVMRLAKMVCECYPELRKDLLLTASFLHDIGKIDEMTYTRSFGYTDKGGLLGHLVLGMMSLSKKIEKTENFPDELNQELNHLILSHHGDYKFGSPKLPLTREAIVLHYIDNIDAKLAGFSQILKEGKTPEVRWTEWNKMFERRLFKG